MLAPSHIANAATLVSQPLLRIFDHIVLLRLWALAWEYNLILFVITLIRFCFDMSIPRPIQKIVSS